MEDPISRAPSGTSDFHEVVLLVEGRYLSQQQPAGMLAALHARGHPIRVIDPEGDAYLLGENDWLDGVELIICRGRSVALQFLIRWAESRNIPCINPRAAIASVFNKAEMAVALTAGGIPTPVTFFGQLKDLANRIPEATYPVVLKPVYGDNCRGLRIVRSSVEMARTNWQETLALAQHFHPNEGYDLKLYGIGQEVWAVRKPSCLAAALSDPTLVHGQAAPHEVPLTQALKTLALRCAELFGLELFGVDCIETPEGVYVIEVNDFPNYSGIPGVDEKLADYVLERARRGKAGK